MDEIKAQELFDFFNQEGYDLGDFNNFTSALTDDVKREKLYSFFNEEGYDVGSIDNFTLKKKCLLKYCYREKKGWVNQL